MAGGMVLREIFTRLGFETDPLSLKRYEEAIASTQKTMQGLGQAAADVGGRMRQALEGAAGLAREGSNVQQIATAFEALGGTAAELDELRRLSGDLVPDSTLQRAANLGKLFKLPAEQIPALLKIAQGASVALGTSVEKNLEDVFVAMARQSKLIADNLGTQMGSVEDINAAYAERNKLNVKALTDEQKMSAFVEAFVEKSTRQADLAEKAAQNQFALFDAKIQNLRNKAALLLNQIFSALMKDFMGLVGGPLDRAITGFEKWWSNAENVERVLRRVVIVARVLAATLAAAFSAKAAGAMVASLWKLVSAIRSATIWSALLKSLWLAIPLAIAAVGLLIEDVMVWLRGGDSLIGRFIKKYEGSNGPAGKIARWLVGVKPMLADLASTAKAWIAKATEWIKAAAQAVRDVIPPIVSAFRKVVAWITPYATTAYNWLREAIPAAIQFVIDAAKTAWGWLESAIGWLFDTGPGAFSAVSDAAIWLWDWIKIIGQAIADAAVVAWDWIKRAGQGIASVATTVGAWLWSVAQDLYTAFSPLIYGVYKLIEGAAKLAWAVIQPVGALLWDAIQAIWSVLESVGAFLWDNIPPALNVIVQSARIVWHGVLLIVEWVGKAFSALAIGAQWLMDKAATVVKWILDGVLGLGGSILKGVGDLVGWIIDKISPITTWIFEKIGAVGKWIADGLEAFNNGVKAFLAWVDTNLVQPISGLFTDIGNVIKGIFNDVMTFIQPVIDLIDSTIGKAHDAAVMLGLADEKLGPALEGQAALDFAKNNAWAGAAMHAVGADSIQASAQSLGDRGWGVKAAANFNAGGVTVQITGSTNMGAQDIANATKSGVEQGMTTARDLAVGE